jgi:cell division protein FtsA
MRDSQPNHYFGLDIGTSKVRCVVGMLDQEEGFQPSIIGYGESSNLGMRKGNIVQVEDVAEAVEHALTEAERISGIPIHQATVNVNGSHVLGINSQGVVAISAANREITPQDCARVEEAATILQLPPNREIIQVFAKNYTLDGQGSIKDPVGMQGIRLEVESHIITAGSPSLRNLSSVLDKAKVHANHFTVSSLAAAEAVLNRQQKESGTLVLDIGAGTTNICVIEDGEIQHVAVLPVGGINITNDLAIGLKTDLDIAELVKVQHFSLDERKNKSLRSHVVYEKKDYDFSTADIRMIVEARLEELFEYVNKELQKIHRAHKLPGGVVIVGGTSKLPDIDSFAREKLQLPARLGHLHKVKGLIEATEDPSYTTAVGLMILDMLLADSAIIEDEHHSSGKSPLNNINKMASKLFGRLK